MVRKKKQYFCQECGYEHPQWLGKCPQCDQWNTFKEIIVATDSHGRVRSRGDVGVRSKLCPLSEVNVTAQKKIYFGIEEFDRVLGGGIAPHSTVLLAGEPGIGKSTLLLQAIATRTRAARENVLFVSAEESLEQVRERSLRLGLPADCVYVIAETDLSVIEQSITELDPIVVVVDSIQAICEPNIPSPPGTLVQVREVALALCRLAKEKGFVLFLIGHVTKDGVLAGPKSLEHLVDTVLYFEGDRYQALRIVRTVKNRFGSTGEIGIFEMSAEGLHEVRNPSDIFLSAGDEDIAGKVSVSIMEGRRPFLIEIQALTNKTSFNMPLRRSLGIELNKVSLLLAVLERSLSLRLHDFDVFVKAVGGLRIDDAACDIAVAFAILSSFRNTAISSRSVFIGELGLSGEIRKVHYLEARIKEAARLGFKKAIIPKNNFKGVRPAGIELIEMGHVYQAYALFFTPHAVDEVLS